MIDRRTRLRFRRVVRRRRRQVQDVGVATEQTVDKYVFRRLMKLIEVRRFVFGWISLLALLAVAVTLQLQALSSHYQAVVPAAGGTYREGIIGTFTNASPLYAQNSVDASVSKLVFSGLLKYDEKGQLINDLAESYSYDASETLYTVKLKRGVTWHDGKPLTAKDVVFTYKSIQNPEVRSHLLASWRSVTVASVDDYTVTFKLPNALSAFPHSMTNGIVPEHVLAGVSPNQLRASSFNNESPIGTGPFRFDTIDVDDKDTSKKSERIGLTTNSKYFAGKAKLEHFVVRTYVDDGALTAAFQNSEVDGMVGLSGRPDQNLENMQELSIPLAGEVMVFFRTSQDVLKDPAVRSALVLGVDKKAVLESVDYPLLSVDEPFLRSHIGYDKKFAQVTGNKDQAKLSLDAAGWKADAKTGIRSKDGRPLTFKLVSGSTSEYASITGSLQKQWRELGADVQVDLEPDEALQASVSSHNYDAILYGIAVGSDPDVYPYWHSTQADIRSDTRLNLSEYKSVPADRALEAGRTRSDPQIRTVKYRPFLESWQKDSPALALYQPRFYYVTSNVLRGFDLTSATVTTDRFSNVQNWTVRQQVENRK